MDEVQATVTTSELHFALETDTNGCSSLKIAKTYTKKNGEGATEFSFTIGPAGTQRIREVVNSQGSDELASVRDVEGATVLVASKNNLAINKQRMLITFPDGEGGILQFVIIGDDFERLSELLNAKPDLDSE